MYDYKAEKLARIAAILFGVFVILGCIVFSMRSSEETNEVSIICAISGDKEW